MACPLSLPHSTLRPLAASLALALAPNAFAGSATGDPLSDSSYGRTVAATLGPGHVISQTRTVMNCSDGAPDSLRDIITNPNNPNYAQSGDTVDLSQLPVLCGMTDSTITLTSGEITIDQVNLTLKGPALDAGTVTISGGGTSRVLNHTPNGMLAVNNLTITNGYYHAASNAYGGCLNSFGGSIYLGNTTVAGCNALSDMGSARGGGVHGGDVTIVHSSVSGNQALAQGAAGYGGGVFGNNVAVKYSSISSNVTDRFGGGAYAQAGMSVFASTIDGNTASYGGGLVMRYVSHITNSTISGNMASKLAGAVYAQGDSLSISNSTIAFNHVETSYGAVMFQGLSGSSSLVLQSSIIAKNTVGMTNIPSDLSLVQGQLTGADNLVMASSVSPPPGVVTVTGDPLLGPLQLNGGSTRTHALLPGSPAIGSGNINGMPGGFTSDQRGPGYPRSTGPGGNVTTDMGAIEFDTIFSDSFDH